MAVCFSLAEGKASLEEKIGHIIASKEEVLNETLQDLLKVALENYTGEDNAEAPCLPKTPSTSRRLRVRQPRTKKKQTDDGSPVLTRTLRSKSKRNYQQKDEVDDSEPLQDIGNSTRLSLKAEDSCEHSFKRSSRACGTRTSQSIAEQSTVKKNTKKNAKKRNDISSPTTDILSIVEKSIITTEEDSNPLPQNTVEKVKLQPSPTPLSSLEDSPLLEPVSFLQGIITNKNKDVGKSSGHTPPALHCQSTKEVEQLLIIDVDDDSTPLVAHSSSHVHHYFSSVKEVTPPTATVVPNDGVEATIQSSVFKEKFFTPPDYVDGAIASEHQAEPDSEITTVSGKVSANHNQIDTPESIHDSHASSGDLARLTRLTSSQLKTPATVTRYTLTPSTVAQSNSHECSVETPVTVTKQNPRNHVSATVTKVKHADVLRKENDESPQFLTATKRPQDSQTCSTSELSGATKKQRVTPTNCFSPAKPKTTVPAEPSGLLHSSHAPPKSAVAVTKKLPSKEQQIREAKERLAEKNRRDRERLHQLEKKKEQERLEKKRKKQEQLRRVHERQMQHKKETEAKKAQLQQKITTLDTIDRQQTTTKIWEAEKPHKDKVESKMDKKMKGLQEHTAWESDEEHYKEEERKKFNNYTNEEYDQYFEEEMQKANTAKARMCSVGRLPTATDLSVHQSTHLAYMTQLSHNTVPSGADENYGLDDLHSDDSTDEEDEPRKPIPSWAQEKNLEATIAEQEDRPLNASMAVFNGGNAPVDLGKIFKRKRQRFFKRTSSAQWSSPPAS